MYDNTDDKDDDENDYIRFQEDGAGDADLHVTKGLKAQIAARPEGPPAYVRLLLVRL